ncbi:MAG: hypothetical protein K2R98_22330 [Gemmataceae bacterium]|nr:hypothetical protein [Gemmataceae bacterium]
MEFDAERVRDNARQATTEDLLDRVTVYRAGMEPEAVDIIESELRRRGVDFDTIDAHYDVRGADVLKEPDGTAMTCSECRRPAVGEHWTWHRLWGVLPLLPRRVRYCDEHRLAI